MYTYNLFNNGRMLVRADIYKNGYFYQEGKSFGSPQAASNWADQKIKELNDVLG